MNTIQNNIRKCNKCNASDVDWNSWVHVDSRLSSPCSKYQHCMDCAKRRLLEKNGKSFCFNCLTSEYNVDCQYCHKRINSKDELAYWSGGILCIDGDYHYCKADDRVFTCRGCEKKISEKRKNGVKPSWCNGWGSILFPELHIRKCRIAGCSQKPYYECMDLCLPHSKPCQGGKIKPNGKRCSAAMGADEGDICESCQNQTETYQQDKATIDKDNNNSPAVNNSISPTQTSNNSSISSPNENNDNQTIPTRPNSNSEKTDNSNQKRDKLEQEIQNLKSQTHLTDEQIQELKDKENELDKLKNDRRSKENNQEPANNLPIYSIIGGGSLIVFAIFFLTRKYRHKNKKVKK